jgi:hypothetical protein
LVGGGALVVFDGDALDDDARERVAKAMVSAACTNACRSDDEDWLEKLLAALAFGWRRLRHSAAKSDKSKYSASDLGDGEENRRRGRGAGSLVLSQSTKLDDDACGLRRKIPLNLVAIS